MTDLNSGSSTFASRLKIWFDLLLLFFYLFIFYTANGFLPGGSGTTIRNNTNNTHPTK
jgi:hypothetical protein